MCVRYDPDRDGWFVWTTRGEIELHEASRAVQNYLATERTRSIFPKSEGLIIVNGSKRLEPAIGLWGLPRTITRKDRKGNPKQIVEHYYNAKSETIHKLIFFRDAFKRRRCLVPATAFYERDPSLTNWFRFHSKDRGPLCFAGIYDEPDEEGRTYFNFATTIPNGIVGQFHDRMPVLLDKEAAEVWMTPDSKDAELLELLLPAPEDLLEHEQAEAVKRKKQEDSE